MTEKDLLKALDNEEPRYPEIAAQLDASDVPRLRAIAEGTDVARATKAVYLASLIDKDDAHEIVIKAARSSTELVRIASASALENLPAASRDRAAERLIDDPNPAIAKLVLRAVDADSPTLRGKIRALQDGAANAEIRDLARSKLGNTN
jgi:HEAT repeat protein